jgi:hypothetical protein
MQRPALGAELAFTAMVRYWITRLSLIELLARVRIQVHLIVLTQTDRLEVECGLRRVRTDRSKFFFKFVRPKAGLRVPPCRAAIGAQYLHTTSFHRGVKIAHSTAQTIEKTGFSTICPQESRAAHGARCVHNSAVSQRSCTRLIHC